MIKGGPIQSADQYGKGGSCCWVAQIISADTYIIPVDLFVNFFDSEWA